jgi:hypothetical protein
VGGTKAARAPGPSFVSIWNWMGLLGHGGYFFLLPYWESIPVELRTWGLAVLALPLFLGHLMLWQARRLKHHRAG